MKILRVIYDWPPPWDGLAPAPYEISLAQVKLGHEITVFSGRWPKAGPIEQPTGVTVKGFWREPLEGTWFFTTSFFMFLHYLIWRRKNTPDLIHTHGHFALWIYLYRWFLTKFKKESPELAVPMVANFHNTVEGRKKTMEEKGVALKPVTKFISWPLAKLSDKLSIKLASAFIYVSNPVKEEAEKYYGADPKKGTTIESGVNTETFKPVPPDEKHKTRNDLKLEISDKIILYNGVMVERKNVHILVKALKHLPAHYKVLLAGPFPNKDYQYKINDIIINEHLSNRVIMTGYIPYPNVPVAFQASDVFVIPSSWEGVPKVVMQALGCNIPVLASGFRLSESISGLLT